MSHCRERDDALDDVAAGGAPSADLASHVQSCDACSAELERRRGVLSRIDAVARAWMDAPSPEIVVRAKRPNRWRVAVAGAALVALFIAGYVLQRPATAQAIVSWRSPTADLLRPTVSVLDTHSL